MPKIVSWSRRLPLQGRARAAAPRVFVAPLSDTWQAWSVLHGLNAAERDAPLQGWHFRGMFFSGRKSAAA